jgi:hypothetical protein
MIMLHANTVAILSLEPAYSAERCSDSGLLTDLDVGDNWRVDGCCAFRARRGDRVTEWSRHERDEMPLTKITGEYILVIAKFVR